MIWIFFTIYKIRFSSKADEGKAISGSIKTKRHLNTAHRTQILLEKAGPGKGSLRYDIGCRDLSQIMFRNVCKCWSRRSWSSASPASLWRPFLSGPGRSALQQSRRPRRQWWSSASSRWVWEYCKGSCLACKCEGEHRRPSRHSKNWRNL